MFTYRIKCKSHQCFTVNWSYNQYLSVDSVITNGMKYPNKCWHVKSTNPTLFYYLLCLIKKNLWSLHLMPSLFLLYLFFIWHHSAFCSTCCSFFVLFTLPTFTFITYMLSLILICSLIYVDIHSSFCWSLFLTLFSRDLAHVHTSSWRIWWLHLTAE